MKLFYFVAAILICIHPLATSFVPISYHHLLERLSIAATTNNHGRRSSITAATKSSLFGIAEWRDHYFNISAISDDHHRLGSNQCAPPKSICILPFPHQEVLLQGEQKHLHLYENRFLKLFDDAIENHCGLVAMGLLAESGTIQVAPLCEIEAYNRLEGFGIFMTIRVVGRTKLLKIVEQEPYAKAICIEMSDENLPADSELSNLMASNIEKTILTLGSMEHRLAQANKFSSETSSLEDEKIQYRINIAKLEDGCNGEMINGDKNGEATKIDRDGGFQQAYQVALTTDTQGYCVSPELSSQKQNAYARTPREMTALSWASFCTECLPEINSTYRIQALGSNSLFDRLRLASQMLREKESILKSTMKRRGIQFQEEDDKR